MKSDQYPYTNYMTLKEWKKFVKNYKKYWGDQRPVKQHLLGPRSFCELITRGAFVWRFTPEGHEYWNKISKRTKPMKQ
jgi:hypothetical protein